MILQSWSRAYRIAAWAQGGLPRHRLDRDCPRGRCHCLASSNSVRGWCHLAKPRPLDLTAGPGAVRGCRLASAGGNNCRSYGRRAACRSPAYPILHRAATTRASRRHPLCAASRRTPSGQIRCLVDSGSLDLTRFRRVGWPVWPHGLSWRHGRQSCRQTSADRDKPTGDRYRLRRRRRHTYCVQCAYRWPSLCP